jgi:hypothetical protein
MFNGRYIGDFCDEHNRQLMVGKTVREMFSACLAKNDKGQPVIPFFWSEGGHPFRQAAMAMVEEGSAVWEQKIVQMGPRVVDMANYRHPNREYRRR